MCAHYCGYLTCGWKVVRYGTEDMERFVQTAMHTPPASGRRRFEQDLSSHELGRLGVPNNGFEDTKGHTNKELFQFPTDVMEQEKAKAPHWQTRFLLLGNPLGESERDLNVKAHSADDVVGAALLFITFVIASVVYGIVKKGDLLFGAPDIEAFFAAIGGSLLFWAVIVVGFVLVMMAISKEL